MGIKLWYLGVVYLESVFLSLSCQFIAKTFKSTNLII